MNRDFDPSSERKRGEPSWRGRSAFSRGRDPDRPAGPLRLWRLTPQPAESYPHPHPHPFVREAWAEDI